MQDEFLTPQAQAQKEKEKILAGLNEDQKQVVKNYRGFSLVSAGPGSGKTRTLVLRTAYMIADGVPAASILLFTFTKKAANEIAERVRKYIGDKACGITVSTYHSFCARQLRRYCGYLDYKDNFSIIDDDDQKRIIKGIADKLNLKEKPVVYLSGIAKLKEEYLTPKQAVLKYGDNDQYADILLVYEKYQKHLKKTNVMDFNDLLFNMVKILETNKNVRNQIWNHFQYICSDEVQDSASIDQRLIYLLANPKTKNLCLIGDSDQSKPYCSAYE